MRHATKNSKADTGARGATEAKLRQNPTKNTKSLAPLAPLALHARFGKTRSVFDILESLAKQKSLPWYEIVNAPTGVNLEKWIEFEERAAILEFDGGYLREEADCLASVELGLSINGDSHDEYF